MKLFKAIWYDGRSPQIMSSSFNGINAKHSTWTDLILTAFTHVSNGDQKKSENKDYWISTTPSYDVAKEYLNKYKGRFNGIAVIDLPNTLQTGVIYDTTLNTKGYLEKDHSGKQIQALWETNNDGVVVTLNMSSQDTLNYLYSYLFLKGEVKAIGNIRATLYANNCYELLIMGENLKYKFYPMETLPEIESSEIVDYYSNLYTRLLANSSYYKETRRWLSIEELEKALMIFYKNAKFSFDRNVAEEIFCNKSQTNRQTNGFEIANHCYNIPVNDIVRAYIIGAAYNRLKLDNKLTSISSHARKLYNFYYQTPLTKDMLENLLFLHEFSNHFYPNNYPSSNDWKIKKMRMRKDFDYDNQPQSISNCPFH